MKKIEVLVPSYYEKFICIGGACEDNCCEADWNIYIDKNTYNLYRGIKDPDFQAVLPKRVKRVKDDNASNSNYAKIVLDEDGKCMFLEDGMCSIQKKYGTKYLSVTCQIFPRKHLRKIDEQLESLLSMACPEAIRVGLYPKEPMTFKTIEMEQENSKSLASLPFLGFDEKSNVLAKYAIHLRQCCIDIMQTRTLPVADRIFVIGMMLQKLRELCDKGDFDSAPTAALDYVASARSGQYDGLLASFADNENIKAMIKAALYKTTVNLENKKISVTDGSIVTKSKYAFVNFIPCVEKLAESLNKNPSEVTMLEINDLIEKNAALYWQDFLDKRGHILENYFVNYIFGNVFPFAAKLGIQHQILFMAEAYALFRILLLAPAGYDYGITEENIIKTITDVFRHTNHSSMITKVTENYILSGLDSLAHVSFMLRD